MVNGASPGPAPAAKARASSSRLTRSQLGGRGPTGSWRRKVPRACPRESGGWMAPLPWPPRVLAVPPVRNTSASSMQSPPAMAEATRVISLSPVLARPGAPPRSR